MGIELLAHFTELSLKSREGFTFIKNKKHKIKQIPSLMIETGNFLFHHGGCLFCLSGGLKNERSSVVSSLDCLSSIVERISTDSGSLMPAADGPGSPPTDPAGEAAPPGPVQIPSPTASQDPNLIYQVL